MQAGKTIPSTKNKGIFPSKTKTKDNNLESHNPNPTLKINDQPLVLSPQMNPDSIGRIVSHYSADSDNEWNTLLHAAIQQSRSQSPIQSNFVNPASVPLHGVNISNYEPLEMKHIIAAESHVKIAFQHRHTVWMY